MDLERDFVPLESIAEVIDSRHKTPSYSDTGYPMVRVVDVKGGALNLIGTKRVDEEVYEDFSKGRDPEVGDLVISRVGSYGVVSYVDSDDKFCLGQNTALIVPKINSRFLYYQLVSPLIKQQIDFMVVGAVQKTISLKSIKQLQITLPNEFEQEAIANILGTLDDKIELNRQMNETLEAMAQALFKSWFVDFDPVIDNALAAGNEIPEPLQKRAAARQALGDQRKPLPSEIQSLFPDSFVFTEEMSWVPEGWEVLPAEDVSEKIGMGPFGSNIKVSTFVDAGVPVISGRHLNKTLLTDAVYNYVTEDHAERLKNSVVKAGDIIFTHAGNIGQVSLIPHDSNYSKYVISQRQFYLRPDTSQISSSYLVYFFRSSIGQHKLLANASQVGVPSIARPSSHLKSIRLLMPSYNVMGQFDEYCKAIFKNVKKNQQELETLTALRDTLLPKLLSGELRLSYAKKQVAEAI